MIIALYVWILNVYLNSIDLVELLLYTVWEKRREEGEEEERKKERKKDKFIIWVVRNKPKHDATTFWTANIGYMGYEGT